ncbi:MAG: tRNA (guanosine(46)-N7)-methyltransferase TrmB [Phycisphaeraceae bacterium]|nr:tRNA (guanosine(46)-N7)-methyltransferase TrmB [Phycisphaeraceae bacterium]
MSFNLGHGRPLDDAPGVIGLTADELPILPDDALANPSLARIDPRAWFPTPANPLEIEIGCGKGTFILETARANPHTNFLGIEWAREFYLYTADRLRRAALTNVRMLRTDAADFIRWRVPSGIVAHVHLYFSDPWPKAKHHKNRVVQHRFLAETWRILLPGGTLRLVTDHDDLWRWYRAFFSIWTDGPAYAAWLAGAPDPPEIDLGKPPPHLPPGIAPAPNPEADGRARAPFDLLPFTPPEWVGEGQTVGTNYERKFKRDDRPPHSAVMKKNV